MADTFIEDMKRAYGTAFKQWYESPARTPQERYYAQSQIMAVTLGALGAAMSPNVDIESITSRIAQEFVSRLVFNPMGYTPTYSPYGYALGAPKGYGKNTPFGTSVTTGRELLGEGQEFDLTYRNIEGLGPQWTYDLPTKTYGWGELAYIYQNVPATEIAQQIAKYEEAGDPGAANALRILFSNVQRVPEPDTEQEDVKYPLHPPSGAKETPAPPPPGEPEKPSAIDVYLPQIRTGQQDVKLNPQLVSTILENRAIARQQARRQRRYTGGGRSGTEISGLLGTLNIGRQRLGG